MTYLTKEWVEDTTTDTGTGNLDCVGSIFVDRYGDGNSFTAHISNRPYGGTDWETSQCHVVAGTPDYIVRDYCFESSNSGAFVNFGSGTKDIISWVAAAQQVQGYDTYHPNSPQTGFTNTATDLDNMSWPCQPGDKWLFDATLRLDLTSTAGVLIALMGAGADSGSWMTVTGPGAAATTWKQDVARDGAAWTPAFITYAGGGNLRLTGFALCSTAGVTKLQGKTGGAGSTASFNGGTLSARRINL